MQIDGNNTIVNKYGYTADIMAVILSEYDKNYSQCMEICAEFCGNDITTTCENIFNWLIENVNYKIDPSGKQLIRIPARFVFDGEGDCKSYSLFTASILRCLGIDCVFRFVSYGTSDYRHVYIVAYDEQGTEIIIDAVAGVQTNSKFNEELKYTKNKDMRGTEISVLSGVSESDSLLIENGIKANINYLNSCIMLCDAYLSIGMDCQGEKYLYMAIKELISEYCETAADIKLLGYVVGIAELDGDLSAMTEDEYIQELADLKETFLKYKNSSVNQAQFILTEEFETISQDFLNWWNSNIVALNYTNSDNSLSYLDKSIAERFDETAMAFLYVVVDSSLLSKTAIQKKDLQILAIENLKGSSTLSFDTICNIISSSIITQTGRTPNDVVKILKKESYIGEETTSTSKWDFTSITNGVNSLAESFTKIWGQVTNTNTNSSTNNNGGVVYIPSSNDFSSSTWMYVVGGGILAWLLFSKKSKKKT